MVQLTKCLGMATHSSILAWRIPWTGTWQATVRGVARVVHDLVTKPPPLSIYYVQNCT